MGIGETIFELSCGFSVGNPNIWERVKVRDEHELIGGSDVGALFSGMGRVLRMGRLKGQDVYKRKVKGKIYAGRKQATQASLKGVAPQEGVTELTGKGDNFVTVLGVWPKLIEPASPARLHADLPPLCSSISPSHPIVSTKHLLSFSSDSCLLIQSFQACRSEKPE